MSGRAWGQTLASSGTASEEPGCPSPHSRVLEAHAGCLLVSKPAGRTWEGGQRRPG